jgi:hypothetical protein
LEILREIDRLELVVRQISEVEAERDEMLQPWLRSAGLSPPGLWTGAPRRCSGGGLRRNAARALAIMLCTVPTNDVWTPPAPGAGMGYPSEMC